MKNLVLVLSLIFSGCMSVNPKYFNSSITANKEISYLIIADDMAKFISETLQPNNTIIYISTDDMDRGFYDYLTNRLRNLGFGVSDNPDVKNLSFISYRIQTQGENVFATYNINESKINRIFIVRNGRLEPTAYTTILKG
jgi:hypothetical protein